MKKLIASLTITLSLIGCTTSQQSLTEKTLSGLEIATTGAYDAYISLVVKGALPTNDIPKISHAYDSFQAAEQLAIIAAQNNTNALASTNLVSESTAVINLITTITGAK